MLPCIVCVYIYIYMHAPMLMNYAFIKANYGVISWIPLCLCGHFIYEAC